MLFLSPLLVFISVHLLALVASACDRNTTVYEDFKAPLKSTVAAQSDNILISGTFSVKDGCTFDIVNFTFFPAQLSTYFYGSMDLEDEQGKGKRISENAIGAYYMFPEASFNLSHERSFSDFRFIKIYSEFTGKAYAYVELPQADSGTSSTTASKTADGGVQSGTDQVSGTYGMGIFTIVFAMALSIVFL